MVVESALRAFSGVDVTLDRQAIKRWLRSEIIRLCGSRNQKDLSTCELILRTSDSPQAQSFRNTLLTNPGSTLDLIRWAGLAFSADVREASLSLLCVDALDHPDVTFAVSAWQQQELLRGDFRKETPWLIIADWHDEHGDSLKAGLCRQINVAAECFRVS